MLYVWLDRTYRAKMDLAFAGDQENCSAMTDTILSTLYIYNHAGWAGCAQGELHFGKFKTTTMG